MIYVFRRGDHQAAMFSLFGVDAVSTEEKVDHISVGIEVGGDVFRRNLPVFGLGELDDYWTDVSRGLPTEDGRFLAAVLRPDSAEVVVEIAEFKNGDWMMLGRSYRDKVIAWHGLPKVFKEGK